MTAEVNLTDEKIRAEVAKLIFEVNNARERAPLDILKAEAELIKLEAETRKINRELRWYPWATLAVAIIGVMGGLLIAWFK